MSIPPRDHGYSIEPDTAIVHERYQDHAPLAMRTSARGVANIADGRKPVACDVCFPAPKGKAQEPEPRDGVTWVDDANGARWVANEDIEDQPYIAAVVDDMVRSSEPA